MKHKTTICDWCGSNFLAPIKELNRGNAKFCSRSCAAKNRNDGRKTVIKDCVVCKNKFTTKAHNAKFCSGKCKSRHYRNNKLSNQRPRIQRKVYKALKISTDKNLSCFICGWNEDQCDIHHITPRKEGGNNSLKNLTVLCLNHHRLADRGKLSDLPPVSERLRTISSSS